MGGNYLMSDNTKTTVTFGGFPGLLTTAFIVLKLLDKIQWSWWWVLSPIWISVAFVLIIWIIAIIILMVIKRLDI